MKDRLKHFYPKGLVLFYDLSMVPISWFLAYWLRHNLSWIPKHTWDNGLLIIPLLMCVQLGCYFYFKLYRGAWRFTSLMDLKKIVKTVVTATVLTIPLMFFGAVLTGIPRSIWPMHAVILIVLLGGGRIVFRMLKESSNLSNQRKNQANALIIGAGQAGESLVRDIHRQIGLPYRVLGFIDDNVKKTSVEIHGVKVLGTTRHLSDLCNTLNIDLIFIAIPSINSKSMRRIVRSCEKTGVSMRTLPSLKDIVFGQVSINELRKVNLDDLLGRDKVELDWPAITSSIEGKRIAVTGGGGSIGTELCRQIVQLKPSELLIIDNCEYNLYAIQQELINFFPELNLRVSLTSVVDRKGIETVLSSFNVQILFHAAAFKHVPMLESQLRLAVANNILGTQVVAESANFCGVETFILISTDKAVNPTNVMGTTKRVAEMFCQNINQHSTTDFITVRFGNVLGSAGSVIPLFQQQLSQGGPLTVTHPDITRYFMTIPEACQLILQAMVSGQGGDIFVLDMGEPVKIKYLAEQMIRLAGKEPFVDIDIQFTGLRAGEKLFEELFHASEALKPTNHDKILKAQHRVVSWAFMLESMKAFAEGCNTMNDAMLESQLHALVPEYQRMYTQQQVVMNN